MIIYLLRSLSYSLSLALSMYVTGEMFRQSVRFFDETAMASEFGIAKMRLTCIGIGACIGIQKAFDRVSLLRSVGLAFVLAWLSTNICYELEISPPKVNLQAAWTGILTGGLNVFGSSLINQQVVDWNFLLIFFICLWVSELLYARADNTDAIGLKKAAIVILTLLATIAALPAGYLMYDAIKHAAEYDTVAGAVELTFSTSMTMKNLVL